MPPWPPRALADKAPSFSQLLSGWMQGGCLLRTPPPLQFGILSAFSSPPGLLTSAVAGGGMGELGRAGEEAEVVGEKSERESARD